MWITGEELADIDDMKYSYLHGWCNEWAAEHYKQGDKILSIIQQDDDVVGLLHCCLLRDGKYVDVRGETGDFDDVLDDFDYGEFVNVYCNTVDDLNFLLKICEEVDDLDEFVEHIQNKKEFTLSDVLLQ